MRTGLCLIHRSESPRGTSLVSRLLFKTESTTEEGLFMSLKRWVISVFISICSAFAGLFMTDKRPEKNETMSMQELAAVQQQDYLEEEPNAAPDFSLKQQGIGRPDADDNLEFETTSFGTVLTAANDQDHTR